MKIITIWQPWASLIAIGAKPYEFRSWPAPSSLHGERIGIHAGARKVKLAEVEDLIGKLKRPTEASMTCLRSDLALPLLEKVRDDLDCLPRSAIVCTAVLGLPINALEIVHEFGGPVNDSSRELHANFAWPLTDVAPLLPPIEARGAQGFWNGTVNHGR